MLKKIVFFSLFAFFRLFGQVDSAPSESESTSVDRNDSGFFDGVYMEVGPSIKIYNASESMDSKSCWESYQTNFTSYGVNGSLGFLKRLSGNFFWGVEGGITYGANSNAKFNGNLNAESVFIQNELSARDVLSEMLRGMANNLAAVSLPVNMLLNPAVVASPIKDKFIKVIRFIGGDNININDNFLTDPAAANFMNANASFKNFIGDVNWTRITRLGGGDIYSGLERIREFVEKHYPIVAAVFKRFGETNFRDRNGLNVPGGNDAYGAGGDLRQSIGDVISGVLAGQKLAAGAPGQTFNKFGVIDANMAGMTFDDFQDDIGRIHFPTDADTAALLQNREVIRNQVKTKITLGVCPHVAMKFAYYFPELHGLGFIKVGAIQLNGTLRPEVDSIKVGRETLFIPEEKFRKVAPLVGAGYAGTIRGTNFGYSVEISHAFRVNKHMQKIQSAGGVTVDNRTSISYTAINFSFIFKFN